MYFAAYDSLSNVLVSRFTGKYIPQHDYDALCKDTHVLLKNTLAVAASCSVQLVHVGRECSTPNAEQRQQLAERAGHAAGSDFICILITTSALVRGMMTAINWIRPQPKGTQTHVVPSAEAAIAWLRENRPAHARMAARLWKKVEADVDQTTALQRVS